MIIRLLFFPLFISTYGYAYEQFNSSISSTKSFKYVPYNELIPKIVPSSASLAKGNTATLTCFVETKNRNLDIEFEWREFPNGDILKRSTYISPSWNASTLYIFNVKTNLAFYCKVFINETFIAPSIIAHITVSSSDSKSSFNYDIWIVIIFVTSLIIVFAIFILTAILFYKKFSSRCRSRNNHTTSTRDLINNVNLVELGANNLSNSIPYDINDKPPAYEEAIRQDNADSQIPSPMPIPLPIMATPIRQ